ncbi:PREDICTED: ELL-associated factor 1 isoform X1 [Lepidothrix coronata]|uniref:ELL-associated factor 1 isoform X1 n=1 Tax=Lepidothrix coronata TaxID=321398 RepID=A0A6J0HFX1_9PASS|nr:PREDICTED: ELL-associated factor 1 isoform X1 [Lepidothrix coronata]
MPNKCEMNPEMILSQHQLIHLVRGTSKWVKEMTLQSLCHIFQAEGSSKIQARIEQQSARASQPPSQFRAPTKPAVGPKTSPLKDNPSPEPQLDDIKRELRAEVEIIEQMSSSSGSSSSDSESSSGSEDESSSSEGEEAAHVSPSQPPHQQYNNRNAVANGTSRPQGSNQLMNTLRNDLQLSESGSDSDD